MPTLFEPFLFSASGHDGAAHRVGRPEGVRNRLVRRQMASGEHLRQNTFSLGRGAVLGAVGPAVAVEQAKAVEAVLEQGRITILALVRLGGCEADPEGVLVDPQAEAQSRRKLPRAQACNVGDKKGQVSAG